MSSANLFFAILFFFAWIFLGVLIVGFFVQLLIAERDAKHPEEEEQEPLHEEIGGGGINRSGWGPAPFMRVALYDGFLAASVKSRRVVLPYSRVAEAGLYRSGRKQELRIVGTQRGKDLPTRIRFNSKQPENLLRLIQEKLPSQPEGSDAEA